MKKITLYWAFLISIAFSWAGCEKENYQGGMVSSYIPIYDLRNIYKGSDVTLTEENMFGATKVTGVVVSDYSGGNMPAGLLVIQDKRRLNELRGISIPIGDDASKYVPGDSVVVTVKGGVLKRVNGLLEVTNVSAEAVTKVASGKVIPANGVPSSYILANPDKYESTLVVIVKGGFDPLPATTDILSGDKALNDGFDNITLHTEPTAAFAHKDNLPVVGNFYGIIFNTVGPDGQLVPQHRMRTASDVQYLSSTIQIAPIIITGFMSDVKGGDGNYEYVQCMATRDIDFSVTPFSLVTTNNAGASSPSGFPSKGWATGIDAAAGTNSRTYKFNLTSGFAAKGTYFYLGGTGKQINGSGSTDMSSSNWIGAKNYTTSDGDGFGRKTTGLFANSGNAFGMAIFEGTNITVDSKPVDVLFIGSGGSLFSAGTPAMGYRITNTDFYNEIDPLTLTPQPFYRQGTNTICFNYLTSDMGYFNLLGGIYNPRLGKWVKARTQTALLLEKTSPVGMIEGESATTLKE